LIKKEDEMNKVKNQFFISISHQLPNKLLFQTTDVFEKLKSDEAADLEAYQAAQKKAEAVNLGLALNDEGEATSLQDQLTSESIKNPYETHS